MTTDIDQGLFCSDVSRVTGEQLFGSVKITTTWLLLEYEGRWQPDAFAESDIPGAVKTHLRGFERAHPQTRLLVIRQKPRFVPDGIYFYVAQTRESGSALYRFLLTDYADLLALDLPAILAGNSAYDARRTAEPLFVVCTHGRRDRCCARRGVPVYEAMAARAGAAVWQTSHVGGHRFAANVICLPDGIVYGRVEPEYAAALVDDCHAGRIAPDLLRGRSVYPRRVQAAEALLRLETGRRDALRWLGDQPGDDAIRFESVVDGTIYAVTLADAPAQPALASCGDTAMEAQPQFRLAHVEVM